MLHVFRHLVERDLFSIVFDWLALLDARSSSLSVGIVFETWCRPRARPPLSLCISPLHFLRFPRDQDNLYLPTSSFLFWDLRPLWCRPHQSKPAQLTHTSLPAAGATAVHQTGVRYTLCSFYGSCWCLTFTHTSAQQCALYLLIWVFTQAADTERVRTSSLAYTFCARPNRRAQAYHYTPTSPQVMSLA